MRVAPVEATGWSWKSMAFGGGLAVRRLCYVSPHGRECGAFPAMRAWPEKRIRELEKVATVTNTVAPFQPVAGVASR
jgi:hypothetical protein